MAKLGFIETLILISRELERRFNLCKIITITPPDYSGMDLHEGINKFATDIKI